MEKELTNDENIANLKKRKTLRILIIICATITIILAILTIITQWLDLGFKVSVFYALVAYIITTIFSKKRSSIKINKNKELENVRKEIAKSKKIKKEKKVKKQKK